MAEQLSNEVIEQALSELGEGRAVTSVASVWAPVVESDLTLAEDTAEHLISTVEESLGKEIDSETRRIRMKVGTAVGALALRRLFEPGQSDTIWVNYTNESGLDQRDALRRVERGVPRADS